MESKLSEAINNKKVLYAIIAILLLIIIILLVLMLRKPKYEVTFDSNGGSEVCTEIVKKNEKVKKPEDPTKEGYVFAGWYYKDELYDFDTPVTKDMTLKAEWAVQGNATVNEIVLNVKNLDLAVNENGKIEVTSSPENKKLVWSSSDESIVKVDQEGNVTGLKEGTAIITVETEDGEIKATCTITVKNVAVEGVSISGASQVAIGSTIRLTANMTPTNATNKNVTWKSSNSSVATVDANGNVRGIRVGTVTITATTEDGNKVATKTIKVVKPTTKPTQNPGQNPTQNPGQQTVSVTSVSISGASTVNVGATIKLTATVQPTNATNKNVTWSSSNPSIATVDANGNVRGVNDGTVTITVSTADGGKVATHTVTVKSVYAITLTKNQTVTGVFQYSPLVTKNGSSFSGYSVVNYNGRVSPFKSLISVDQVNEAVRTAQITLSSGAVVTASVSYR